MRQSSKFSVASCLRFKKGKPNVKRLFPTQRMPHTGLGGGGNVSLTITDACVTDSFVTELPKKSSFTF